ncbi:MAG: 50S ribosome-binding GTPase [Synechococcales cyanobacterium C42_A2020_086]|nr:50S ribosome-binding GTPase [Synechococcales cyanobacterium C42_A2020_086]
MTEPVDPQPPLASNLQVDAQANAQTDVQTDAQTDSPTHIQTEHDDTAQTSGSASPPLLRQFTEAWGGTMSGVGRAWHTITTRFTQLLPWDQVARTVTQWFSVSEAEVAEILASVRAELPTTEAVLIGKPQTGKSSIIRGLTGVSAEIVGQGFRPHTQYTQRYTYPTTDLPLLIFTDTVGLGDVNQNTEVIIQELVTQLEQDSQRARVLILTVKITDFAIDSLRQIAQRLRQRFPQIPCLLAVTCLHELYPSPTEDHPAYPPDVADINRAYAALQDSLKGLYDSAVLIDFTLEEDGYTPVFYGLEAFRDALADLLPEAEARTIHQLLDTNVGEQLGNLYRDVGRRYSLAFAVMAGTLAAVPLPFATMPVLTSLQVSLVGLLGKLYGQTLTPSQAGGVVSAIAGGFLAQAIGRELIKFLPGFGSVIAASWAAAYTWALGEAACVYFGDLMGGKKPDAKRIQAVMEEAFQQAKERFKGIQA